MRHRYLDPVDGFSPIVGRFVAMFADTRRRLHRDLEDIGASELDEIPGWGENSIGTLLYHLAAIELDWTFSDLLGADESGFPDGTGEWFPIDVREEDGKLSPVVEPLSRHLGRLEWVRGHLLNTLRAMTDAELDRTLNEGHPDNTECGGAWVLHHLMQHEAEHRGQIGEIRVALRS